MSTTKALCVSCSTSMPFQWRNPLDMFSVDGCDLCGDTTPGAELHEMTDPTDARAHTIVKGVSVGDRVMFHTDDPMDPAGWEGALEVREVQRTPMWTLGGPVRYSSTGTLEDGSCLDADRWHKIAA